MFPFIDLFNEDLTSIPNIQNTFSLVSFFFFYIKVRMKKFELVFFINIPTNSLRKVNSIIFYIIYTTRIAYIGICTANI